MVYKFTFKGDGDPPYILDIDEGFCMLYMQQEDLDELRKVLSIQPPEKEYQSSFSVGTDAKGGNIKMYLPLDDPSLADMMVDEAFRLKTKIVQEQIQHLLSEEATNLRKLMEGVAKK